MAHFGRFPGFSQALSARRKGFRLLSNRVFFQARLPNLRRYTIVSKLSSQHFLGLVQRLPIDVLSIFHLSVMSPKHLPQVAEAMQRLEVLFPRDFLSHIQGFLGHHLG